MPQWTTQQLSQACTIAARAAKEQPGHNPLYVEAMELASKLLGNATYAWHGENPYLRISLKDENSVYVMGRKRGNPRANRAHD